MIKVEKNRYKPLSPEMGALYVVASEAGLEELELPDSFKDGQIFINLRQAIERRRYSGFETDPTSREEVRGLVCAVMGGFDHLHKVQVELQRFVVGVLQTEDSFIQKVRDSAFFGTREAI